MTPTNEMAAAIAQALEQVEREKNISPTERLSAGYDEREGNYQEALAAEERLQGRPLDHREKNQVRKSLNNQEGGVR